MATNEGNPSISGGGNLFTNLDYGIEASGNSYPLLGEFTLDHSKDGENMIYGNGVDVANSNNTFLSIYAIYNYWDSEPGEPDPVLNGLVQYKPWLEPESGSGGSAQSSSYGPDYDAYLAAYGLESAGSFSSAQSAYETVIDEYPGSAVAAAAISGLVRSLTARDMAGQIIAALNNIITTESGTLAADYARQHLIPHLTVQGEYQAAMQQTETLLAVYDSTAFAPFILLDQLYILESQGSGGLSKGYGNAVAERIASALPMLAESGVKRLLDMKQRQLMSKSATVAAEKFDLSDNYPNPFNPSTTIRYQLRESANVMLAIYNILGQRIRILVQEMQAPGHYTLQWDGRDETGRAAASGVYIYRIQAGRYVAGKKMILLR